MIRITKSRFSILATGLCCLATASIADARKLPGFSGNCAELPADRTTEFHGNPATSNLNLAMAGNQWVVWPAIMQGFNERRASRGENIDLTAIGNQARTHEGLQKKGADYFIELIPPGQERNQIKSWLHVAGQRRRSELPAHQHPGQFRCVYQHQFHPDA